METKRSSTVPRRKPQSIPAAKKNSATNPAKSHVALNDNGSTCLSAEERTFRSRTRSTTPPATYSTEEGRIRALFLDRKPTYTIDEAAHLLGVSRSDVFQIGDEFAFRRQGHVTFEDLMTIAVTRWSFAEIEDALGGEGDDILPAKVVASCITLRLPSPLVGAIQREARRLSKLEGRRVSVSAAAETLLHQHFTDDWRPVEYFCERFDFGRL